VNFVDVMIRQAHPGPGVRPYHSIDQKRHDAERYRREENIPWPILVDDLAGAVHQAYGGLADPSYLIGADGKVAFYNMWTHAPTLHRAIVALVRQGGSGVVLGGIDRTPHMLAAMTDGWKGIRRGLPQSFIELEIAFPGVATGTWLGHQFRPLLAPLTLRSTPLPTPARIALAAGAAMLAGLAVRLVVKR
jgi:hypothetical protein